MNPTEIRIAVAAANLFIKRANDALATVDKRGEYEFLYSGKESGALRRSSMELTRSLASMRRPR